MLTHLQFPGKITVMFSMNKNVFLYSLIENRITMKKEEAYDAIQAAM